jgi:hypothetical protein
VRAISLPTALPVAAAALALVAAALAPLAAPSTALAERWLRPVPGAVARPFSYSTDAPFVRGAHRGADLAARPGATVRAACSGRVVYAGAVPGGDRVVSVRCGDRRVSYLPLAAVAVRADATINAGAPIGTVAPGHGGLHVGVRREGDPFGYQDPMALLPPPDRPFTPVPPPGRRIRPRRAPRGARPRAVLRLAMPMPDPRRALAPLASPATLRRPLAARPAASLAPWPVWAGLGAVLAGAAGSGAIALRRRVARSRSGSAPAVQAG